MNYPRRITRAVKAGPRGKAPKLSEGAKELLAEANGASDAARNAWLAFLALLTYLLVTLGGVSHKNLLLNSPVNLPIINVDVPLFNFFQYAPALMLLVYLSLLIQHVILARKYRKFTEAIAIDEEETRKEHPARELVHSYLVSQILAGPTPNPIRSWLMRLMVFVTFVVLPVITLLYFQIQFLPYHDVWITYWHRIAVLLGLAMLFAVMPIIHLKSRKREIKLGSQAEAWRASPYGIVTGAAFAILVLSLSWLIVTVPAEEVERWILGFVPPTSAGATEELLNPIVRAAYECISLADNPEGEGGLLRWLISYRVLVVEDTDMVPDEGDTHDEVSVVLRKRDFRFARLSRSDLHRSDLTQADLSGAELNGTRLEKAKLNEAELQGAAMWEAKLQGADVSKAKLQDADLLVADLRGAHLTDAKLQGAKLGSAKLQGAVLTGAELQKADLFYAELQSALLSAADLRGANLGGANLQGANLGGAHLEGANLGGAHLEGANLTEVDLQGANLGGANLQGANLDIAYLQGANLGGANLQGANLTQAELEGANLVGANLQGAVLSSAELEGADLTSAEIWLAGFPDGLWSQFPVPLGLADLKTSPPTADDKAEFEKQLRASVTDGQLLGRLLDRLNMILRDAPPKWEDEASWSEYVSAAKKPSPDELAQYLAGMACGDSGGDEVLRKRAQAIAKELAGRAEAYSHDYRKYHYAKPLARALLEANCEGAKALTEETRATLRSLATATE